MALQNDKEKAEVVQLEYASRQSAHDASASPREKSPADDQGRDHVDVKESLWQATKRYPKVVLYGFGLTFGSLLYGYDTAVVGNVSSMLPFMRDFGQVLNGRPLIPATWLALWKAVGPVGAMLGAVMAGIAQDKLGRRLSLVIGTIVVSIGVAICFVSNLPRDMTGKRTAFLVGKIVLGTGVGQIITTTQTFMSEIVPTRLRGPIMSLIPAFTLLGQLIGAVVIATQRYSRSSSAYLIPLASQWAFALGPLVVCAIMPESPIWLIRKGKTDKAMTAIRRLRKKDENIMLVYEEMCRTVAGGDQLHQNESSEDRRPPTFKDCFSCTERRRTFISLWAYTTPQLWGVTLLANSSYFVQMVGMDTANSLLFLVVGIVLGLIANLVSTWLISKSGRRPLMLSTLSVLTLLWLGMGIAGCFQGVIVVWYTAVTMMVVITVAGLGVWPSSYAVGAEVSSIRLRAKAQGLGWLISSLWTAVFSICLPYAYNPDAGDLKSKTGFIFVALSIIGMAVTYFVVPEMKDRKPTEIDRMFELGLSARKFKSWTDNSAGWSRAAV
ncbi:alpha-glucosides permease-like protein [Elsinoe australis]|uniref:Alpha-glucosides permease-like protein n=1 Tax=Elsinoe australis TaxID=40998 RepID=A0A4U7AML1_9PEZI|nr:alpha-glucosides permease-like protein [Elsinoe australis]